MSCIIFTDGASKGNPGRGGWGAILATDDTVKEIGGREHNATNNQMELKAVIEGLGAAHQAQVLEVKVYSDSQYVINGITKWIFGWQKKGWKTVDGKAVVNEPLWTQLEQLAYKSGMSVAWEYTGGHIGIAGNVRVDTIASDLAEGTMVNLFSGPRSGYTINISDISSSSILKKEKTVSSSRSKLKAYSYISEVDGVVKIHKTWNECESRVKGKKARFKKALSVEEESALVKEYGL